LNKELKKQIKEDELVTGVEHAVGYARLHESQLKLGVIAVAVLLVGGISLQQWMASRAGRSELAFGEALAAFQKPLAEEAPEGSPKDPEAYPSAQAKFEKSLGLFEGVARDWSSQPAGRRASYYAALCQIELGKYDEAARGLAELAKGKDGLEPALSRLALAEMSRRQGKLDAAIQAYRQIAEDAAYPLPRDQVRMRLASALEDASRLDEAVREYRRVADDPQSTFASDARRKADFIQGPSAGAAASLPSMPAQPVG
jgi:hypothetical protein